MQIFFETNLYCFINIIDFACWFVISREFQTNIWFRNLLLDLSIICLSNERFTWICIEIELLHILFWMYKWNTHFSNIFDLRSHIHDVQIWNYYQAWLQRHTQIYKILQEYIFDHFAVYFPIIVINIKRISVALATLA